MGEANRANDPVTAPAQTQVSSGPLAVLGQAAWRLRLLAAAVDDDLERNGYWGPLAHRDPMQAYAAGVSGGLGGAAGSLAAAWTPEVTRAAAAWLEAVEKRAQESVTEDSMDCPNCGTACAGHPMAWWCDRCGGAIESEYYIYDPCTCYTEALALARQVLAED